MDSRTRGPGALLKNHIYRLSAQGGRHTMGLRFPALAPILLFSRAALKGRPYSVSNTSLHQPSSRLYACCVPKEPGSIDSRSSCSSWPSRAGNSSRLEGL